MGDEAEAAENAYWELRAEGLTHEDILALDDDNEVDE